MQLESQNVKYILSLAFSIGMFISQLKSRMIKTLLFFYLICQQKLSAVSQIIFELV
jgi:hypothetical protein